MGVYAAQQQQVPGQKTPQKTPAFQTLWVWQAEVEKWRKKWVTGEKQKWELSLKVCLCV